MENNVITVVEQAIRHYKIKVTKSGIKNYFLSHPYYPSFKCISDAFEKWNIEHYPLKLNINELKELRSPFIAHINSLGKQLFAFIYEIKGDDILYSVDARKKLLEPLDSFSSKFTGAIIFLKPDKKSFEYEYRQNRQKEMLDNLILPFGILIISVWFLSNIILHWSTVNTVFLWKLIVIKALGLFTALLLVLKEFKISNSILNKFCNISPKTDCDALLNSNAAIIYGWINWADAGLIYFTGSLLCLSSIQAIPDLGILPVLSIIAIPYPLYSIYYQAFKVKKWCPLCLLVQAVIIAEFIYVILNLSSVSISVIGIFSDLLYFSIITGFYMLFKVYLIEKQNLTTINYSFQLFKRNPKLFIKLLQESDFNQIIINENSLIFGNPDAPVTITAFLSFNCKYCKSAYKDLMSIVKASNNVKLLLVFLVKHDSPEFMDLIDQIYYIYKSQGQQKAMAVIENWYSSKNKGVLQRLYDEHKYENVSQ